MTGYVQTVDQLQTIVMDESGNIVEMYLGNRYGKEQAVTLLTTTTAVGAARATALADTHFAWTVGREIGAPVAALGLAAALDIPIVQQIVDDLLDSATDQVVGRVRRFTGSQVTDAAARAYSRAVEKSPLVRGWKRDVEPGGCQLCQWWSREGRVWPDSHYMPTHPGCRCRPHPVIRGPRRPLSDPAHKRSARDRENRKQLSDTGHQHQE